MKALNEKLSKQQAQKELKQFSILGLVFGTVPLLIFGWIAIAGLAFSTRALILAKHTGNENNPKLGQYQTMAIAGLVLSVISLIMSR